MKNVSATNLPCAAFISKNKSQSLIYKGTKLECGFRLYLLVEGQVVVERNPLMASDRFTRRSCCPTFVFLAIL